MGQANQCAPLGVFDSGLGGLTVVRALRAQCPHEDIIYLGDNARVPYGTRSPETVMSYALNCATKLASRGVKALVVACNTVSSVAIEMLRGELDLPITGVIVPGARAATAVAGEDPVGVLGTAGTIASGAYTRAVAAISSRTEVIGQPAPLLVALAEEGWTDGEVPRLVVQRYLSAFLGPAPGPPAKPELNVACVVLGCTHFPLFRQLIADQLHAMSGQTIPVVDSAVQTAADVRVFLEQRGMAAPPAARGKLSVLVTDMPESFERVASRFLGEPLGEVEHVHLGACP
ncbi:MAG: glutamate racemase [Deltaproteobacteria bacterium]|nr:MAG: glutamate racemase [Deltaproteobacteria bacterium]